MFHSCGVSKRGQVSLYCIKQSATGPAGYLYFCCADALLLTGMQCCCFSSQDTGHPTYVLLAKLGDLYLNGGHGLEKDPSTAGDYFTQAGDAAMAAMKGKMANKYYMRAEEAWAECD